MTRLRIANPRQFQWISRLGKLILVILPLFLLWWTFARVPLAEVWAAVAGLESVQIGLWLSVNLLLVILMTGRWWLILRSMGYSLPYLGLTRYRLAAFAVSYFTPGPQFGGEPLQVLALRQRHHVPVSTATASVGLDKLLELIANFSFLVFGVALALAGAWLPGEWRKPGITLALGLLAFPLAYLILMLAGRHPLGWLARRLPARLGQNRLAETLRQAEAEMSRFCVSSPRTVLTATLVSLAAWVGMVFEYWLMTRFLGLRLSLTQALSALVAARLALLTPLPGGLGALEASQALALQALGLPPSFGVGLALLIRLRDLLFGIVGFLGAAPLLRWPRPAQSWNPDEGQTQASKPFTAEVE